MSILWPETKRSKRSHLRGTRNGIHTYGTEKHLRPDQRLLPHLSQEDELHQLWPSRSKRAWEIEHSVPRSKGGTDHGNNLFGAHITCNREKSNYTTQTARRWHGISRAPLSRKKMQQARASNTAGGALIGGLVGLAGGGPIGAVLGALGGAAIGNSIKPK